MSNTELIIKELESRWNYHFYLIDINNYIHSILNKQQSNEITYDILDSSEIIKLKIIALKIKQYQMKIGNIWQYILGNYKDYKDLKNGDETGLDIISYKYKIIIELKNRTNTDNYSSKKSNLKKLSDYKKKNQDFLCIYGCINEDTEIKTKSGIIKEIVHNNQKIYMYTGYKLLNLILKNDTDKIIRHIQNICSNYLI